MEVGGAKAAAPAADQVAAPATRPQRRGSAAAAAELERFCSEAGIEACAAKALREAIDLCVADRVEEMWQKGKQMLSQFQQESTEKLGRLAEELAQCRAESQELRQQVAQLSAVGGLRAGEAAVTKLGRGTGSSTASGSTSPDLQESAELLTPEKVHYLHCAGEGFSAAEVALWDTGLAAAVVPEMPPFLQLGSPLPAVHFPLAFNRAPTPPQCQSEQRPFSLAEALAEALPVTPARATPALRATPTLRAPGAASSTSPALRMAADEASVAASGHGEIFSLTLNKAGTVLGLNVSHSDKDQVLYVEGIYPGGAAEAWNQLCATSGERPISLGDRIVGINGVACDPDRMLQECREQEVLTLSIMAQPRTPPELPGARGGVLRADASVFVPRTAGAACAAAAAAA